MLVSQHVETDYYSFPHSYSFSFSSVMKAKSTPLTTWSFQGVQHLGPATDFYKKLALDCSGQQIGVDLFLLSSQYADLASLCKRRFSTSLFLQLPAEA